jgi:formylglycine-generating enzyme required for sulfatase activity
MGQGGIANPNSNKNPAAEKRTPSSGSGTRRRTGRRTASETNGNNVAKCTPTPAKISFGPVVRNSIGMELVLIPAGSFCMGSNNGGSHEKPVHQVRIKEHFYMGRYEVTQVEWQQMMGTNPSYLRGDRLPVEQVSWDDVQNFLTKLNERGDRFKYWLPTEAEWEYACRAGRTGDQAGGLNEMAWYVKNSELRTHAVGLKQPNAWGLTDMR